MFLCILGVLSFLQIVLASSGTRRVVLVGEGRQGFRAPFQVFCTSDGVVVIPPVDGLRALEPMTAGSERRSISDTIRARRMRRHALTQGPGSLRRRAAPVSEEQVAAILAEIREVNRVARHARHAYEEFVLFGVYPGGGDTYREFRAVLDTSPFTDLRSGVEVLDSDYAMAPIDPM